MIKLTFIGANHQVTGSMHLLQTPDLNILVDCGMEQGIKIYENAALPLNYCDIDYIILTHAHIDHSGMIPNAYKNGFRGTVLTTDASMDLDKIMLLDSANIQEQEAETENKKARRSGKKEIPPAYTVEDAQNCLKQFRAVPYGKSVELSDSTKIRFIDAGHLLGSASAEVWVKDGEEERKIVFSGDIGNKNKPLIRDPEYISKADYILCESTYGNRKHEAETDHVADLCKVVQRTLDRGGNVLFPAFAVGRTQELLYLFRIIKEQNLITGHPGFPVYVDSPLAIEATKVFVSDIRSCFDDETRALVEKGINPLIFDDLRLIVSTEESKKINNDKTPKVIISAAGMCNAGRIRHHLRYNLWRPQSSVVFAGYQAEGTLGRKLQDGAQKVTLFGDDIVVKASIETLPDMSSHADCDGLLDWIGAYRNAPKKIFLVHGNDDSMAGLSEKIKEKFGYPVDCPYSGSVFDLVSGEYECCAEPVYAKKETYIQTRNSSHKERLEGSLRALTELVGKQLMGANADMDSLSAAIDLLVQRFRF